MRRAIAKFKDRFGQREKGRGRRVSVSPARCGTQSPSTEQTDITPSISTASESGTTTIAASAGSPLKQAPQSLASEQPNTQLSVLTASEAEIAMSAALPLPNNDPPMTAVVNPCVWADAYEAFVKREPQLAVGYNAYLTSVSGGDTVLQAGSLMGPTWAKCMVENLQKNREDKQWHINFHGKTINFREQAEKLVKVLIWGSTVVKDVLSTQPYAALAWSGVSILLPLLTSGTAKHESMLLGFDKINGEQIYWKAYEDSFPEKVNARHNQTVRDSLVELYSHVFEYHARVICHLSSNQVSRAWEKVAGWDDWEKKASYVVMLSNRCKDLTESTQRAVTEQKYGQLFEHIFQSREALQQIYESIEEGRKQRESHHEDQRERELLADLAENHEANKNFHPEKVIGTCEWLLEHPSFRSWRDRSESGLFWVSASPGCGKSVLSRSLIDERQLSTSAATSIVCYFFFKSGDESHENSYNALSAILHQLFVQDLTGKFIHCALKKHKNYGEKLAMNSFELWNILLDCASTPDAGQIVCVLDALDECKQDERNTIIDKLRSLFSNTQPESTKYKLKFFVTCRPYDTIERSVGHFWNSSCLRIDEDADELVSAGISKDINLVIDDRIPKIMPNLTDNDRHRISKRLKDMENRTYLWLRLTFYIIEQNPSEYDRPSDIENLLDDLPDEHAAAYEKILEQTKSKSHASYLFQLMLAATRPLSVDEANYALALAESPAKSHSTVNLWKNDFESTARNFCGLLVSLHDSKLFFIHQTVREFLTDNSHNNGKWEWRGRFKLPECHSCMAHSCIRYLSLPELNGPIQDRTVAENVYPFLSYSAEHWPFHYRELDREAGKDLLKDARNLCRLTTGGKQWMEAHDNDDFGTWSLWTELAFAAFLGIGPVARAIIDEGDADVEAYCGYYGTALQAASAAGFPDVVQMLLDEGADINAVLGHYSTSISAAACNGHLTVVRMLLERWGQQIEITEEVLVEVARNEINGKDIMALLLEKQAGAIKISVVVVYYAGMNEENGSDIMALLLEKPEAQVKVTPNVLYFSPGTSKNAEKIVALLIEKRGDLFKMDEFDIAIFAKDSTLKQMTMLLEKWGDQVEVTEDLIIAAAGNEICGKELLSLLSEKYPKQVEITTDVMVAAAGNYKYGNEIMTPLLRHLQSQVDVPEDILVAAAGNPQSGNAIMTLLLEKFGDRIDVTRNVMIAAARNLQSGVEIIALLLEHRGVQVDINEDVLVAAASNISHGRKIITLLLMHCEGRVNITEEVLVVATRNWRSEMDIMALLLQHHGDRIAEDILVAAAENRSCGKQIISLLFEHWGDRVHITEDVAAAAAGNLFHGRDIMALFLEHREKQIDITKTVIIKAAKNDLSGHQILALLLKHRDETAVTTRDFVCLVSRHFRLKHIALLLEKWGSQVKITQDVIIAAAKNEKNGKAIMSLLLEKGPEQVEITNNVVTAAASNWGAGGDIMTLLLERRRKKTKIAQDAIHNIVQSFGLKHTNLLFEKWGAQVEITQETVSAAAQNNKYGEAVMSLLLEKHPDKIKITEEVVVEVAQNRNSGRAIMGLLLEKCDEVEITEDVVLAAAGNSGCGKAILELLLEKCDEVKITEDVVLATAGNDKGEAIMALLLEQYPDQVEITEDVVVAAARHGGRGVMSLLLKERPDQVEITEDVVVAAAENRDCGAMALLLEKRPDQVEITKNVVVAAAGNAYNGRKLMSLLLNKRPDQIEITEDVVVATAGNELKGEAIMALLLKKYPSQVEITKNVVVAAAGNAYNGRQLMSLLLNKRPDQIEITEDVVVAAARSGNRGLMALLLEKHPDQVKITKDIVIAAAANVDCSVMALLLEKHPDQVEITKDVVIAAAGNTRSEVMALLLEKHPDQVEITKDVAIAAAGNTRSEVMALLLEMHEVEITEGIVVAAARNRRSRVMALLLEKRPDQVQITRDVVAAAAKNETIGGGEIMALLLEKRPEQVEITDDVLVVAAAAAGNYGSGKAMMELLLEKLPDQVEIPGDIVVAAARNWRPRAMALLLEKRPDQVRITKDVVVTAAKNEGPGGKEIIALLLEKRSGQVEITSDVLTAAAGNMWRGKDIMALLLKERPGEVKITEDVIAAATGNTKQGKRIMALLRKRGLVNITENGVASGTSIQTP